MRDNSNQVTGGTFSALEKNTGIDLDAKNFLQEAGINPDANDHNQLKKATDNLYSKIDCSNTVINSQSNVSDKFCSNTVINPQSRVSDKFCSNTVFNVSTTNITLYQTVSTLDYDIGSIILSKYNNIGPWYPPFHELITWTLQPGTVGSFFIWERTA